MASVAMVGCQDEAQIASKNMVKSADNFEIPRRIVFYNAFADKNIVILEGKCSIEYSNRIAVICKTGFNQYTRTLIDKNEFVVPIVEQLDATYANGYHYRRTFNPQAAIPDIDFRGSTRALQQAVTPDTND